MKLLGITELILVKGKVHVLGDYLSRAPQVTGSDYQTYDKRVLRILIESPPEVTRNYSTDEVLNHICLSLLGTVPHGSPEIDEVTCLVPEFSLGRGLLEYRDQIYVPCSNVCDIRKLGQLRIAK